LPERLTKGADVAEMLFGMHSGTRYLVLLAGVVATVIAIAGLARAEMARGVAVSGRVFLILLDVQVVLGIVLLVVWPFYGALVGHIVMMILAVVAGHGLAVAVKRRPPTARPPALQLAAVLVPLVLVIGGILAIGRPIL
jgi:hypothetical protein